MWIGVLGLIGLAAGFLAGLLGVGGGVVIVPALVLILGFDQHVAQGTSLLVIIPGALLGATIHYRGGRLSIRNAAWLAVGGVVSAVIGSLLALSVEDAILRRLFAVLVLASGLRMIDPIGWWRGASRPPPEGALELD